MQLITPATAKKAANPRVPTPFYKKRTMRFPTPREIQSTFVEIGSILQEKEAPLIDRFFPEKQTLATEIEMYLTRTDDKSYVGMIFPHQIETDVRTFDIGAKVDLAKASWSPINFMEAKSWGATEMLELSRLDEDLASSQFNGEVAKYLALGRKRMRARKVWMCWNILRYGKLIIDKSTPDNPNKLKYAIDYGVTDHYLDLPVKIDDVGAGGQSLFNPVSWIRDTNRAAKFTGRKIVELVVNSNFVEYLADNSHIRTLIDYERGVTTLEVIAPPREFYAAKALDVFKRYAGQEGSFTVTFNDDTYEDDAGQSHYWFPDGEMLVLYGNTGPLGNFVNTAHIVGGAGADGTITISTGEYVFSHDNTKTVKPTFDIVYGFNGMPQLTGYDPLDFGYHRFKWVRYARTSVQSPALPKRFDIGTPIDA